MEKILLLIALCLIAVGCSKKPLSEIKITNISNLQIKEVKTTVCGQEFVGKDVSPGNEYHFYYNARCDSEFDVKVEFVSGRKIYAQEGYVTNGLVFQHDIAIDENKIMVIQRKKPSDNQSR